WHKSLVEKFYAWSPRLLVVSNLTKLTFIHNSGSQKSHATNPYLYSDMRESFDIIIIGSGLGGLVCATILAKEGRKVLVLEKNRQYGGNLQTFVRNRCIFDTGVHYLGGLAKDQNLYQYFNYLGIADKLRLKRMDKNGFDRITFDNDANEYPFA